MARKYTYTVRLRCYRSRTSWTFFLRNIWYILWIHIMFVTTSLRWIIHQRKWRMKEIIFTRYNQTNVTNKKDTLQATHTSFVNTVMDNTMDNRVLNNLSPPMNDKEVHLSRQQRAILSQLRSGHCKLLNPYKKRLKQTDSSSCLDCGMDPHDVHIQ